MAADTRTRMVEAAVEALQRSGVAGMSFTDILNASGAARGAIYHHFPGGKTQLVTEAAIRNGAEVRAYFAALPADNAQEVVEAFLALVRPVVLASTTGSGCAVAAVAVGPDSLPQVADCTFSSWIEALADRLVRAGLAQPEADGLATMLVTLLEGAHILCRAAGTLEPFEHTARTVTQLMQARYPGG